MATAGKVAPTPKDKFINGEPYEKLDVVEYNGNLYIAKKASSGVLPTDTEYWMLAIGLSGKLDTTGDTENNTVTFESGDETDPTAWKDVNVLASKEKHSSILNKISNMFSNIRYLYKNVGGIKGLSSSSAITTQGEYALDAREKNASVEGTLANQISTLNSNLGAKTTWIHDNVYAYSSDGNTILTIPNGATEIFLIDVNYAISLYTPIIVLLVNVNVINDSNNYRLRIIGVDDTSFKIEMIDKATGSVVSGHVRLFYKK